ncbi:MAG: nucleotidyltransferase family protein [bacterium]|nr:nucleotidyltransferase family protein [bacterium]
MGRSAIIILAAGNSSRLGRSKQLEEINGRPLLLNTLDTALESQSDSVLVVLGAEYEKHRQSIAHNEVMIVENKDWSKGMGSSIKCGMNYLLSQNNDIEVALISVCDQPFLSVALYNELLNSTDQINSISVSRYGDESFGVPVAFYQNQFESILNIGDETGAKSILKNKSLRFIDFPKGHIDIDKEEDLIALKSMSD